MYKKDDVVTIRSKGYVFANATVLTAHCYNNMTVWYVEFRRATGEYGYWKQDLDGGSIEMVKAAPEPLTSKQIVMRLRDECKGLSELIKRVVDENEGVSIKAWGHDMTEKYMCYTFDIIFPVSPYVTLYMFVLTSDDGEHNNALLLVGDEGTEMDKLLYSRVLA